MKLTTTFLDSSLWLLLGAYVHAIPAPAERSINTTILPRDGDLNDWDDMQHQWNHCDSINPNMPAGTKIGLFICAASLNSDAGLPTDSEIRIDRTADPQLLCEQDSTKVWMSVYHGSASGPAEDTFTFKTSDVRNLTLAGSTKCCPYDLETDSYLNPCMGWGVLGMEKGRNDVIISVNNGDGPEIIPCNALMDCPK
ncbi:Uu.00g115030.m01.CDS01 [Anthostomella pinea]|uniref:Uu.00g115030.m01.CDS01 n=1 Tax=Anthostomella pinea TaxID=933095 RepID=A0AAI8YGP5_9PEZI|nr:Uu.00g115030.m01.CDS01 [Anthostomella pinea]